MTQPDDQAYTGVAARNMAAMWTHAALASGGRVSRWVDAVAADAGAPNIVANRTTILDAQLDLNDFAARVRRFYAARSLPWGVLDPWSRVDMSDRGFHRAVQIPSMVLETGSRAFDPPPGLVIQRVEDEEGLLVFKQVLYGGFDWVPWPDPPEPLFGPAFVKEPAHVWLGWMDGHPAASSVSFVADESVGIYLVATLPKWRGKGIGEAMSWAAAAVEPSLPALLQASRMGRPIYERMGFRVVSLCTFWSPTS